VQLIIAGKAHPADQMGKDIIKQIFEIANTPEFKNRIAFLEDYDLDVASFMVQGVDIWLNTPRRPMEACGTSGMKVAMNGGLNVSILDGWWDEAYQPDVGWAIGERQEYANFETQDQIESDLLYTILEREIIPTFYQRDDDSIPREWIRMMKTSMKAIGTGFNSHRMLRDYTERYYLTALDFYARLSTNDFVAAKNLAEWRRKVIQDWSKVEIIKVESQTRDFIFKGNKLDIKAWVQLGEISAEDVVVECYHGPLDVHHQIEGGQHIHMTSQGKEGEHSVFTAAIPCTRGGRYGFTIRILTGHKNLARNKLPGLIRWFD
jgi:starch phosphorylase